MSLIEEALRKVQQPLPGEDARRKQPPKVQAPPPPQAPAEIPAAHSWEAAPSAPAPRPAARNRRWPVVLPAALMTPRLMALITAGIFVLTVAMISGGLFWLGRADGGRQTGPSAKTAGSGPSVPPPGAMIQAGDTDLILSGVVVGVGEPYAVINGEILAIGDSIAGAEVLDIAPGAVTLRLPNGREAALRVPR